MKKIIVIPLFLLSFSIPYFFFTNAINEAKVNDEIDFKTHTDNNITYLKAQLEQRDLILRSISNFFLASDSVNQSEFKLFSQNIKKSYSLIDVCWLDTSNRVVSDFNSTLCQDISILLESQIINTQKTNLAITRFVKTNKNQRGFVSIIFDLSTLKTEQKELVDEQYFILLNKSQSKLDSYDIHKQRYDSNLNYESYSINQHTLLRSFGEIDLIYSTHKKPKPLSFAQNKQLYIQLILITFTLIIFWLYFLLLIRQKSKIELEVHERTKQLKNEVAERKKAQLEAEESGRVKSDFLANMSHEIRTPMNGVLGMLELLSLEKLTIAQKDYINTAMVSGQHLMEILNDILDLSKIEAGMLELHFEDFVVEDSVRNCLELFSQKINDKSIIAITNFNTGKSPLVVKGDRRRLEQVIINMISNAVKFTENGEIKVSTNWTVLEKNKYSLELRVIDTGIGISNEDISKLFNSFRQIDNTSTRRYGGTGLGLSISKHIIEAMGGSIQAESRLGHGTTFIVRLPFTSNEEKQLKIEEQQGHEKLELASNLPLKILVAEDNLINQKIAVNFLKKLGYDVDLVGNGLEALERAQATNYDLIFMDIQMPEMNGLEAAEKILQLDHRPIIIAMTANVLKEDQNRYKESGMTGFVPKPVSIKTLSTAILKAKGF